MISKFFDWLGKSSADPTQIALTAKGLMTSVLPFLMFFVHNPNFGNLPDAIYAGVIAFFAVISSLMVFAGLMRKLYLSFAPPQV